MTETAQARIHDPNPRAEGFGLSELRLARSRIAPHVRTTPLVPSGRPGLSLKLENLQETGSFKIRGAMNRLMTLAGPDRRRRILTVSAGNHGRAVAKAATALGMSATVVVPAAAPQVKIDAIRSAGGELEIGGDNYDAAERRALDMAADTERFVFVSPYNDAAVVAGQGTVAFEILEQSPGVRRILVPVGGGGLASGVALVTRQLRPDIEIVGVQAEVSAAIHHSLEAGRLVTIPDRATIADGIQGNVEEGSITFDLIRDHVDRVVTVSEDAIREAMRWLLLESKAIAEGAGAVGVAAVLSGVIADDTPTVAIVSGGNVDPDTICDILQQSETINSNQFDS